MHDYSSLSGNLEAACEHADGAEDSVISYVVVHKTGNPKELYEEAISLPAYLKLVLIGIMECSQLNIFEPWFKAFLEQAAKDDDADLAFMADDLLHFYERPFAEVSNLE